MDPEDAAVLDELRRSGAHGIADRFKVLAEENARLHSRVSELHDFLTVVDGTCDRLSQTASRLRKTS